MAIMFPKAVELMKIDATDGEKKVYKTLKASLDERCFVYYEPNIKGRYPDFVVIIPELGILVLEVKDWTINTIISGDKKIFKKFENYEVVEKPNPLDQAWQYMMTLINKLKEESTHLQNLSFAYDCGVIYTQISRAEFESKVYKLDINEKKKYIFKDDLEKIDEGINKIYDYLKVMFKYEKFFNTFKNETSCLINNIINPSIISIGNNEIINKMDKNLENEAEMNVYGSIGIYGTPGSGKTTFIVSRAKYLINTHKDWDILIICETNQQVNLFKKLLIKELTAKVTIADIETFIQSECVKYLNKDEQSYSSTVKLDLIIGRESGLEVKKYDAILIDEILNFREEYVGYLKRIALRDCENSHFVFTLDGYQNIKRNKYKITWIGLREYKKIELHKNYRNSKEIVDFIKKFFLNKFLPISVSTNSDNYDFGFLGSESLTNSKSPEVIKCKSIEDEYDNVIKLLDKCKGTYAVICFDDYTRNNLENRLKCEAIKFISLKDFNGIIPREHIVIGTVFESKGLQFDNVFVLGIKNELLGRYLLDFSKMLYVAFTRAKNYLYIGVSDKNIYTSILSQDNSVFSTLEKFNYNAEYCILFFSPVDNKPRILKSYCLEDILEPDNSSIWIDVKLREKIINKLRKLKTGMSATFESKDGTYIVEMLHTKVDGISAEELELVKFMDS